jgi:hypothetical protein
MIEALYEKMIIPESCRLGKRVYKKLFHENAKMSATDKKTLNDDVDTIIWQYTFKPTTILYRAAMDRIIALACAEHSGYFSLKVPNGLSVDERVDKLKQVENLQQEKAEIQSKLKKEKNLGTQVQLNIRIKQITDSIKAIKREL